MSISGEIDRIRNNVQNTLGTIAETGVNVAAGANSNALPAAAAALANEKQNKLTGTKGHIVGFDASGNAVAQLPANIAIGTCTTAAETAEKVITITSNDNWTLMAGCIIVVKFSETNTASNPTFNVNGTGAKSVWYNTALITTGSLSYAGYASRYGEYAYDGTQFVFVGWSTDSNSTYSNASLGQGYGTCSTAAATAAKTVSLSSYALTKGGVVAVKFTYAVPANATMNINSKGAKNIYYRGAKIIAGIIEAGDIATFIYDGTQYHLLTIDSLIKAKDAVLFSAQTLTAAQQTQARTNIGAQAKLTGAAGQVVGFDASGNAIAQDAPSGGGGSAQADWNQNDSTAADYVKNRPFYSEHVTSNVLNETTLQIDPSMGSLVVPYIEPLEDGGTYIVNYNGTEYTTVARSSTMDGVTAIVMGETFMVDAIKGNDEPFVFMQIIEMGMMLMIDCNGATEATVSIRGDFERVKKIDDKFINTPTHTIFYIDITDAIANPYLYLDTGLTTKVTSKELRNAIMYGSLVIKHRVVNDIIDQSYFPMRAFTQGVEICYAALEGQGYPRYDTFYTAEHATE